MTELEQRKTWAEIDLGALRSNYLLLRDTFCAPNGDTRLIAVVKAEAYGHGAPECVRTLLTEGCDFFAVSCIEEAVAVRKACDKEGADASILILGYTDPENASILAEYDLIQTSLNPEYAKALGAAAQKHSCTVRVHIATDTGMNRIGVRAQSESELSLAADKIEEMTKTNGLSVEGMFTHFYSSDGEDEKITDTQAERFVWLKAILEQRGIRLFSHASNSAGSVRFPEYALDGVRLGIMLYGVTPSKYVPSLPLKPVMSLKTVIAHIHTVNKGEKIGYGGDYCAERTLRVATLPVGYADGLLRRYTGASVTVGNSKACIVGRICMDQCMIDVSSVHNINIGDEVTVFGDGQISADVVAEWMNTINYEVLCLVSKRIPRIYKEKGREVFTVNYLDKI